jgi:glucose/arabinose dehydrogenase/chitodextrinase
MSRLRIPAALLLGIAWIAWIAPRPALAQTFVESGFVAQTVVTLPIFQVVGMTWADDGAMYIWQKDGLVRVFRNGALLETPFLDFRNRVNTYDDRGMLGLALDPDFLNNRFLYLAYVYDPNAIPGEQPNTGPMISRVTRVTADASRNAMLPGSEVILLDNIPAEASSHTVGALKFASDGTIFFSNGDGATASFANAAALNAQNIDSLSGKILRFNPDGTAPAPPKATNPFYDGTNSIRSKVWAFGLRNPFRFDLHPTLGTPYACDVGWNSFEEVNRVVPGGNFGWPCYEGVTPVPEYQQLYPQVCGPLTPGSVIAPLYTYDRSVGSAAVGGAFYTGSAYPQEFHGNFFFSDYTGGWMRRLVLNPDGSVAQNLLFATDIGVPVTTAVGPDGLLYVSNYVTGQIRRFLHSGPVAVASATPTSGYSPLQVSFSSAGSTGNGLTYAWDFGDGGTSTSANPTHNYVSGSVQTFEAELTVQDASSQTSTATVEVTVGSLPPTPTILAPADGVGVQPGVTVNFQGAASDPDETLPGSALTWQVLLHHNDHVHSHVGGTGDTGSFVAEYHGIGTYSYEVILSATDSSGLVASTSVQVPILPDTTPPTAPTGLVATLAGGVAIQLDWNSSTDNAVVAYYRIERCTGVGCVDFSEVDVSPDTSFTDLGLSPLTRYRYQIRAVDPTGNVSLHSNMAGAQTPALPPQQPGLVAAYAFDEGSETTVDDLSTFGNDGSIIGAAWTASGHTGNALIFDGIDDQVVVPDASSLDLTTGMTLEAWVYPTSALSGGRALVQKQVDAYFLNGNTSSDRPGVGGTFAGTCCTVLSGTSALPVNQWTHVAGTYDGATLRLYVNGTSVASQAITGSLEVNALPLRIGGNTHGNEFFPGRIDDVRIYDRALSASEIQADMVTPVPEPDAVSQLAAGALLVALLQRLRGARSREARRSDQ